MSKFRFFVLGLPFLSTHREHSSCAFTQKNRLFCRMMMRLGHEVIHLGGEGSEVDCTEHVQTISANERDLWFPRTPPDELYRVDWNPELPLWRIPNERAALAILARAKPGDFLCTITGYPQKLVADTVGPSVLHVEYGIGYPPAGCVAPYKVFESYAHLHVALGQAGHENCPHLNTSAVINGYFQVDDFPMGTAPGDYFAFTGRICKQKGVDIAAEAARDAGVRLVIAGRGGRVVDDYLVADDGLKVKLGDGISYVGALGPDACRVVVGNARAIFAPSQYAEPFGNVVPEAALMGVPAITTDWGAFPETVEFAVTGFRCRTPKEFCRAAQLCSALDRAHIRDKAIAKWSLESAAPQYECYFKQISEQ